MTLQSGSEMDGQQYRAERDQLDRCLTVIEEAIERGEQVVSVRLADVLCPHVPSIERAMQLTHALDLVFASQQEVLSRPLRVSMKAPHRNGLSLADVTVSEGDLPALSKDQAEGITARIKQGLDEVFTLLLEAHERRAWVPLKYPSWERYVRVEFQLSRSRSYELLDQARVMVALRCATGDQPVRTISALAATQIKPFLADVVNEVRQRLDVESPNRGKEVDAIVRQAVWRARARSRASAKPIPSSLGPKLLLADHAEEAGRLSQTWDARNETGFGQHLRQLHDSLAFLAGQGSPRALVESLTIHELDQLVQLPEAAHWLGELLIEWMSRKSISPVQLTAAS